MKRWLILLSLWPAASYATPDSKAMTVDSVSCAVQAVDLADGHEREVLIHRGAADGAVVGWRG
ncbi:MAG: hypothetical protein OER88_00675, partial [Planctomycetota bacterium]|nr:hypothetical protein [Planctomycetota bacterium]